MEAFPAHFWKSKKVPWFWKTIDPNSDHLWVKFIIQNVVLIVYKRKISKMSFFLCFWRNVYRSALVPRNLSYPEKFLVMRLHSGIILFAKRSILNLWQCSEYVCLDHCSVICTVNLCYALHQTHSECWHIQNTVYYCKFRHTQAYSPPIPTHSPIL